MRRRQLSDVEPDALRIGDESERQIVDQRVVIQASREARPVEQPLDLRGKEEGIADGGVVEGFLPRPIPRAEQAPRHRAGEKPFYYAAVGDAFLFASEIK